MGTQCWKTLLNCECYPSLTLTNVCSGIRSALEYDPWRSGRSSYICGDWWWDLWGNSEGKTSIVQFQFQFQHQLTDLCRLELLLSSLCMLSLGNLVRIEHFLWWNPQKLLQCNIPVNDLAQFLHNWEFWACLPYEEMESDRLCYLQCVLMSTWYVWKSCRHQRGMCLTFLCVVMELYWFLLHCGHHEVSFQRLSWSSNVFFNISHITNL